MRHAKAQRDLIALSDKMQRERRRADESELIEAAETPDPPKPLSRPGIAAHAFESKRSKVNL
jgi:hypothetical protein